MTPARDPGGHGVDDATDVAAELVRSAMAAREAAHVGAVILGRAVAATRERAGSGRHEMFEEAVAGAAEAPDEEFRLVLRWMAGSLIATAELAGEVLGADPGVIVGRVSGVRSLVSRRGRGEGGVARAMISVVEGLACDAPSAECALEGLATELSPSRRRTALGWSAEVTVGLLSVVGIATGHDEASLLCELAEDGLLDPAALLDECGVVAEAPAPDGTAAAPAGEEADAARSFGEAIRTAAAERRAIGVVTAHRTGDPATFEAALAGLSRREIGEVCGALAGCVAGASALADAALDDLVEGVGPVAARFVVDQAGAIGRGASGVDAGLRRWLHGAGDAEVLAVVGGFAEAAWAALAIAAADSGTDARTYLRGVASDIASELAAAGLADRDACPCRSGWEYGACCGR